MVTWEIHNATACMSCVAMRVFFNLTHIFLMRFSYHHELLWEWGAQRLQWGSDEGWRPGRRCRRSGPCRRGLPTWTEQGRSECPARWGLTKEWHHGAEDSTGAKKTPPTNTHPQLVLTCNASSKFCGRYVHHYTCDCAHRGAKHLP